MLAPWRISSDAAVAQVVGAEGGGEAGPGGGRLELVGEELALAQRPTPGRGEHQCLRAGRPARWAASPSQRNRGSRTVRRS